MAYLRPCVQREELGKPEALASLAFLVHSPRETPAVQSTVLESSFFFRALKDLMDQLGSRGPRA